VVLAVPVAPPSACSALAADADEVICLETPGHFMAIGEWYQDFSQTSDREVVSLLFDLLTAEEEQDRANVFDIGLLAGRLGAATRWMHEQPGLAGARVGYFGASTGAAAALWAAAEPGGEVAAVVSRGGRPDLAMPRLAGVWAPTLLIVGALDDVVLGLNREAQRQLRCENHLAVVPGASHLFEEPGTLERVAGLARDWFTRYLAPAHARA
jgi:putative phosphoribosyl transferase